MVFWDFQGVDNWNTGSKWVQWMELSTLTLTRNYSLIASKQLLVNTYFPCSSPRQSRTFIEKVLAHVCFSGNRRSSTREMDFFGYFFICRSKLLTRILQKKKLSCRYFPITFSNYYKKGFGRFFNELFHRTTVTDNLWWYLQINSWF